MEINNQVYISQQNNHSNGGNEDLEQPTLSDDFVESYDKNRGVRISNNNNVEKGSALRRQLEDRVLFRFVPKHVISEREPVLEQTIRFLDLEHRREIPRHARLPSGVEISIPSKREVFDSQASLSDSLTSSLSECSPLFDESRVTALISGFADSCNEAGGVTSEFQSTVENTPGPAGSQVSESVVLASGLSGEENSLELQEYIPVACKKTTVSYELQQEVPELVQKSTLSDEVEEETPLECKKTTLSYEHQQEVPVLCEKSSLSGEVEEEVPLECKKTTLSYEVPEEVPVLVQKSTLEDEIDEEVPLECNKTTLSYEIQEEVPALVQKSTLSDEVEEDVPLECNKTTLSYEVQEEVPILVPKSTIADEVEEEVPLECKKTTLSYELQQEVSVLVQKTTLGDEVEEETPLECKKTTLSYEVQEEVPVLVQKSTLSDEVEEEVPLECNKTTLSYEVQEEVPVLVQKSLLSDEVEEEVLLECKKTTLSYELQQEVPVLVQKSLLSDEVEEEVPLECKKTILSFDAKPDEKNDLSATPIKSAQLSTRSFCTEDKEFEFLNTGPVKRSSSLKSSASSSSLQKKKEVRFADVLGLDLESVQLISTTSDPPVIPRNALRDLTLGERWNESRRSLQQVLQLCACFSPHGCAPDFAKKAFDRKVMLETFTVDDRNLTVSGSICVANVAYVKRIFVRYTTNGWLTYDDVNASGYLGASFGGRLDKFLFKIKLPASFGFGNRMEFAISFESGGHVYWDNNFKANYRIECYLKQLP